MSHKFQRFFYYTAFCLVALGAHGNVTTLSIRVDVFPSTHYRLAFFQWPAQPQGIALRSGMTAEEIQVMYQINPRVLVALIHHPAYAIPCPDMVPDHNDQKSWHVTYNPRSLPPFSCNAPRALDTKLGK